MSISKIIIDIIVPFATPIIILLLGIWAKNIAINYEKRASLNDRIIKKRVDIYETIGKDLNDIFVYLLQVGDWKEFSPNQIIEKKRDIDRNMYISRPYWSDSAFLSYTEFMNIAFETYTGVGSNAKIKTNTYQLKTLPNWEESWEKLFSNVPTEMKVIIEKYSLLIKNLSSEFGYRQDL
ncbi:hypothetical protein [Psychrilyobacter atlanticus]|uniref:hypothetical protein n=1 Tax=Psychrilyobacter atlanticus TaxID=271091 RepID=UPI000414AF1B|nr:hypothetical protein [Psychrilyobacter atlanticus]